MWRAELWASTQSIVQTNIVDSCMSKIEPRARGALSRFATVSAAYCTVSPPALGPSS